MKTELRVSPHSVLAGQFVVEVWHDGQFIATVAGTDDPGVRVISKHPMSAAIVCDIPPMAIEIRIDKERQ